MMIFIAKLQKNFRKSLPISRKIQIGNAYSANQMSTEKPVLVLVIHMPPTF